MTATTTTFATTLTLSLFILSTTSTAIPRILHEPLYPIQWTPPPPPLPTVDVPSSTSTAADVSAISGAIPSHTSSPKNPLLIATILASVLALALLVLSAFLLYRSRCHRNQRSQPNSKTPGHVENGSRRRSSCEYDGSPYRKLGMERALEMDYQPSPELQPLPPLRAAAGSRRFLASVPKIVESDEESFCGSKRSMVSAISESSNGSVARRSLLGVGSSGVKEPTVEEKHLPLSRRLSEGSNSDVKRTVPPSMIGESGRPPQTMQIITRVPLPPPPPPPPPRRMEANSKEAQPLQYRLQSEVASDVSKKNEKVLNAQTSEVPPPLPPPPPPPPPPPLHSDVASHVLKKNEQAVNALATNEPYWKRRLLKPLPAEAIIVSRPVGPSDEFDNGVGSSSQLENDGVENLDTDVKPRLKPLHWDKVRASSDRAMVWDQLKSSSFQLNEDMIETLFVNNVTNGGRKDTNGKQNFQMLRQESRVLDPKKAQNIAILLKALNVTSEEVAQALLDGNPEALGAELLEALIKMVPTKEEELKLADYTRNVSTLGSAERFLKTVLDVPFAFKRVDAMLYRVNFDAEVNYLMKSFETLEAACEDLKSSRLFLKLLEAVLRTGNRMNVGTNRGDAKAFKLDSLLKLADVKGTDGKTTLLHFVVQEIIRSEGAGDEESASVNPPNSIREEHFKKQGLKVVAGLSNELGNVRKAAGMDSNVLSGYVSKLEAGVQKITSVLQHERSCPEGFNFFNVMKNFHKDAERVIGRIKAQEKTTLLLVKDITEYFHGDAAKEEAHPLRIFMVVRDFLSMLDTVCKEVGIMHERTSIGSARSFRMAASATLPVLQRYRQRREADTDDEDSSTI